MSFVSITSFITIHGGIQINALCSGAVERVCCIMLTVFVFINADVIMGIWYCVTLGSREVTVQMSRIQIVTSTHYFYCCSLLISSPTHCSYSYWLSSSSTSVPSSVYHFIISSSLLILSLFIHCPYLSSCLQLLTLISSYTVIALSSITRIFSSYCSQSPMWTSIPSTTINYCFHFYSLKSKNRY